MGHLYVPANEPNVISEPNVIRTLIDLCGNITVHGA